MSQPVMLIHSVKIHQRSYFAAPGSPYYLPFHSFDDSASSCQKSAYVWKILLDTLAAKYFSTVFPALFSSIFVDNCESTEKSAQFNCCEAVILRIEQTHRSKGQVQGKWNWSKPFCNFVPVVQLTFGAKCWSTLSLPCQGHVM